LIDEGDWQPPHRRGFDSRITKKHRERLAEWQRQQEQEREAREKQLRAEQDAARAAEIKRELAALNARRAMHVGTPAERLAQLRELAAKEKGGAT
jgi:hypothetical protein